MKNNKRLVQAPGEWIYLSTPQKNKYTIKNNIYYKTHFFGWKKINFRQIRDLYTLYIDDATAIKTHDKNKTFYKKLYGLNYDTFLSITGGFKYE